MIDDSPLLDHDKLDLESAGRITYRLEQSFRYDYDAPVTSVRQRLVVVPPARHGDLHRRAHRVAVTGAAARRRVVRDAAGNTIVQIHAPRVERGVELRVTAVLERVRGDGPPVLPASVWTDPRLSRPTRLTAAEALASGRGVCQDQAHLMLALCQLLGLPARYVSGHLLGQGGTHAWVEVIVHSGW